jgi:lipid A 4'-phosphatase
MWRSGLFTETYYALRNGRGANCRKSFAMLCCADAGSNDATSFACGECRAMWNIRPFPIIPLFLAGSGLVCLVLVCLVLALAPHIDLAVAGFFYANGHFIGDMAVGRVARYFGRTIPFIILIGLSLLWLAGKLGFGARIAPRGRSIVWLLVSMALGPGLLIESVKDISHRPRPVHVREFGGAEDFRPFYRFDGTCPRNCSFPSGEASAAFWTLAPASLAPLALRPAVLGAGLVFGLAVGGLRMAFGGHFLSDVLAAGILTIGVIAGLRWAILPRAARTDGPEKNPGD